MSRGYHPSSLMTSDHGRTDVQNFNVIHTVRSNLGWATCFPRMEQGTESEVETGLTTCFTRKEQGTESLVIFSTKISKSVGLTCSFRLCLPHSYGVQRNRILQEPREDGSGIGACLRPGKLRYTPLVS